MKNAGSRPASYEKSGKIAANRLPAPQTSFASPARSSFDNPSRCTAKDRYQHGGFEVQAPWISSVDTAASRRNHLPLAEQDSSALAYSWLRAPHPLRSRPPISSSSCRASKWLGSSFEGILCLASFNSKELHHSAKPRLSLNFSVIYVMFLLNQPWILQMPQLLRDTDTSRAPGSLPPAQLTTR